MTRTTFAERLSQLRTRHVALGASLLLLVGVTATLIGTRPLDKACEGQAVTPADDLVALVNGTADATFCLSPGLYNIGNNTLRPGDNDQVIGAPVTVAPNGAIQASTKIFGTGSAIVDLARANGVLLENLDISGATGNGPGGDAGRNSGVGIVHGKNTTLRNLVSHDNANAGVKAFSGQVDNIELYANGSKPYTGVTAAGIKSARSFEVSSSYVHDNLGVGVWADIHAESLVVSESVVVGNELAGVRWEHDKDNVGGSAIVARNLVQKNGDGGVAIDSASSADITGNLFGGNTDAVTIEEDKNPVAGIAIYGNILGPEGDKSIPPDQLNVCDDKTIVCYNNADTGTLPTPDPSVSPLPSPSPEPSVTPEPSPTPDPSPSPEPTPSPEPSPSPQPSPSPSPNPPVQGGVVIAAAGDLCKPDGVDCKKTSDLIAQDPSIDAVLTLGDNQYENGELSNFQSAFDPAWGRFKNILHPSPGNHDPYNSGYKDYFNVPQRYSFNLGNWHLVSLDSNEVSGSASFLSSDLAKDNHSCEIVYWHHARFSSGANHGSDQSMAPLWDIMYKNGVDVNLVGHDHIYERFEPQSPDAKPDPNGVQQFTVGTGGDDLRGVGSVVPNSTKREANIYGIIKMKLGANDYSWEFVAVGGQVLDSGTGTCHGAAGP